MVRFSPLFIRIAVIVAVSAVVVCSEANASVIGGFVVTSQTNSTYVTLNSAALDATPGNNEFTNPFNVDGALGHPLLAPVVNIGDPPTNNLDQVTALPSNTNYTFLTLSDGLAHNYAFNITVNNASAQTIHALGFVWSGPPSFFSTNGINNLGATITSHTPLITNAHEIVFDPNLASGSNQTYTFDFQLPASGSLAKLGFQIFAAAPEPTSLILGAIGIAATGGFGFMRRRKPKAPVAA